MLSKVADYYEEEVDSSVEALTSLRQRGQFAWLGLIGSATKRQTFINRLVHRGIKDDLISQLRCPVGSLSLQSSEPASIALSIAAELARLWEQTSTRYAAD